MDNWQPYKSGVYSDSGLCICMRHPQAQNEWDVNRHLIAAIPDMYRALELFLAQYDGDGEERRSRPEIVAARAAIAKAKGGAA
jgi:hypothetical protein